VLSQSYLKQRELASLFSFRDRRRFAVALKLACGVGATFLCFVCVAPQLSADAKVDATSDKTSDLIYLTNKGSRVVTAKVLTLQWEKRSKIGEITRNIDVAPGAEVYIGSTTRAPGAGYHETYSIIAASYK
jgi:hypothetical protein